MDRIATLATTEALANASGRGNRKRGSFIVVERTQSLVACASAAKRDGYEMQANLLLVRMERFIRKLRAFLRRQGREKSISMMRNSPEI